MINISELKLGDEERQLISDILTSGQLAQGARVAEFEEQFRHISGGRYVAAVSSGTAALTLALKALGIGAGDEVITTPFTFAATVNAILDSGASARLVDIQADTYLIDPSLVATAITDRTRAIMPVHLFGQPADMGEISAIAQRGQIRIVEDAAQAHGALYKNTPVGSFDVAAFSFYATKNLSTGEGGAVTTNDSGVDDAVRTLRNQGMRNRYEYVTNGYNHRMTEIAAAIGIAQMRGLHARNERRRANAEGLIERLRDIDFIRLPVTRRDRSHAWHQFTIALDLKVVLDRDDFVAKLRQRGVIAGIYYPRSLTEYGAFRGNSNVICDSDIVARDAARRVVSLPVHPYLSESDLDVIADAVRAAGGRQ